MVARPRDDRPHSTRLIRRDKHLPGFFGELQAAVGHAPREPRRVVRREARREDPFAPALEMLRDRALPGGLQKLELALARLDDRSFRAKKAEVVFLDRLGPQNVTERHSSLAAVPHRQLHPVDTLEH